MIDTILQDLTYGARSLRRTPGFTVAAVVTLALGIGANTAIFSLLDAVMLRPLSVERPGELFAIEEVGGDAVSDIQGTNAQFAYPQFERFQAALPAGTSLAAISRIMGLNVRSAGDAESESARGQLASGGYFSTLGVGASLGRVLTDADDARADQHPVAVISDGFWRRRFGGSTDIVGRELMINNVSFTIVGVAAPGFDGVWVGAPADVWMPLTTQHAVRYRQNFSASNALPDEPWLAQEGISWLNLVIRVPPVQREAVRTALAPAHRVGLTDRAGRYPEGRDRERLLQRQLALTSVERGFSGLREPFSTALYVLMGMVTVVLLVACLNIANLLLARAAGRRREVATRLSLGASRTRLVRQFLSETLLLAAIGGAAGAVAAQWIGGFIAAMVLPAGVALNGRILALASVLSLAAALLCGVVPALRGTRIDLAASMHSARGAAERHSARTMRPLVAMQMGLSFVLVMAAALFGRSLMNLSSLDPGFERDRLVTVAINPLIAGYTHERSPALHQRLVDRVSAVPGVASVAVAGCALAAGCRNSGRYQIEGYEAAPDERIQLEHNRVGTEYFSTVGIRLVEGRTFDARDTETRTKVVIINESTARRYFRGQSPLGKRLEAGNGDLEVVGVVADARTAGLLQPPVPMVYYPLTQPLQLAGVVEARVNGDARTLAPAIRRSISQAEPRLVIASVTAIDAQLQRNLARQRLVVYLTSAFGVLALLLGCVGLYGVMAYGVARRLPEMGVRVALGARPADVQRLVLGEGMRVVAAGIGIGLIGTWAAGRGIQALLFGVEASDPLTYGLVLCVLTLAALAACALPARRAARVDPAMALRAE